VANNFLASPIEDALSKAPSFGLPDNFRQSAEGRQSVNVTPGNVPFQSFFQASSRKYGVPVNVLMALAQQESGFNPTALGQPTQWGRAKGLMQYIDDTANGLGINPYDPVQSIDAAARQLRERLDKGYSMQEAVQAHFGGDDRKQWGAKTRAYGVEVLGKAQRFFDGTAGPIKASSQNGQQTQEQQLQQDYPAAQSAMENMDQNRLRDKAARISSQLDELNKDEPGRYRLATPEEIAQLQSGQRVAYATPEQKKMFEDLNASWDKQEERMRAEAERQKSIGEQALAMGKDSLLLLNSGLNTAAADAKELVSRIPYIGKSIVDAGDRFDRWRTGKGTDQLLKENQEWTEKNLSPEMQAARKKAFVIEPGDDLGNGKKSTGWNFGPAWSDPRTYMSGILESLPEMAVTMGGSGRLAQFAYRRALASGATREAAAAAAARTATVAGGILEGSLGGAQSARQVREEILSMKPEQLKDSEALKALMDGGKKTFEQARAELAEDSATKAFVLAGIGTGIFGGMGDRALAKVITSKSGRLRSALTGMIGEGLFEEAPQSALQQTSENYAMQEADPKRPLMKGVANQTVAGAAVGGIMGAGMGFAAPHVSETDPAAAGPDQSTEAVNPEAAAAAQQEQEQAQQDAATAAAPTQSRDDSVLSADAGPIERALRGTADQPDDSNGQFWAGEPGSSITVQDKDGDPDTTLNVKVERYQRNGSVTVRDEHGTPYELSPEDVKIVATASPVSEQQQMQTAGTPEKNRDAVQEGQDKAKNDALNVVAKAAKAFPPGTEAIWKNADHDVPVTVRGIEPEQGSDGRSYARVERDGQESFVPLDELSPANTKTEAKRSVDRPLTDFSEDELRDRMRYLARQAKTNGGWDKTLTKARREVEKVLDAKVRERENGPKNIDGLTELEDMRLRQLVNMDNRTQAESDEAMRLVQKRDAALNGQQTAATADENTVGTDGLTLVHGSGNPSLTVSDVQIVRTTGQKQGKKGRVYGGFYGTSQKDAAQAEGYAGMMEGTPTVYDVHIRPGTRIFRKEGDITRLSESTINDLVSKGYGVVVGTDPRGRTEYAVIDKGAIADLVPRGGRPNNEENRTGATGDAGQLAGAEMAASQRANNAGAVSGRAEGSEAAGAGAAAGETGQSVGRADTSVAADTPAAVSDGQQGSPLTGGDGKPKWFSSAEKAQGHIDKKGITGYRVVQVRPNRFEIHSVENAAVPDTAQQNAPSTDAGQTAPAAKTTTSPTTNRVKKLIGEVGDLVSPSGDVGYASAGSRYRISRIEKNGTVHLVNQDTAAGTTITRGEMEAARSRNISWNRQSPLAQGDTETQTSAAKPAQSEWQAFDKESGTLGLPRAEMPQVKAEHRGAMVNFLDARGIEHWEGNVPADTLKPTQAEFSPARVARAAENTDTTRSILVSNDGYVVDGHHQWLAAKEKRESVKAIILDAPVSKLLPLLHEFPSSLVDTSSASGVKQNPENVQQNPDSAHQNAPEVKETGRNVKSGAAETASNEGEKPEVRAADYGANNKLVSQDRAAELRKRLKAKFSQLNSGIDPEILAIGTELAVFHIEASARKFADFARAMAADLDMPLDRLRPYLRSWYNGARDMMEDSNVSIDGMDDYNTVRDELARLDAQAREQQPAPSAQNRQTGGLDDMVAQFDKEVEANGDAAKLGESGTGALGRVPANEVRGAEEGGNAGERAAGRGTEDGRGNERSGGSRPAGTRSVGNDTREVPVSAGRTEPEGPAGRAAVPERSSAAGRDVDAAGRGRARPAAGVTAQEKPASLFTIDPDAIGQGGKKAKYRDNVAAILLLKDLERMNRQATAEEQAVLAKYVGWGGIPEAFARTDGTASSGWAKEVAELKDILQPAEMDAAVASTRNAHYTSPQIVSGMWQALQRMGFTGGRVIEPSVGVGNFFGLMPHDVRKASALHGVELDRITSGIAAQLYPEAKIARMGYQEYTIPDGYFDVAIGNPPFGSEKLYDGNRKDLSGFSIHNYFFARSVDALRPGGVLAMVVTNRFLDSTDTKARQYIADRANLLGAIRLPNDAFAKNAGTEVTTDIIFLQKPLEGAQLSSANRSWLETADYTDKEGNVVPLNRYFVTHPENMLGEFGAFGTMYRKGDTALVARDGQNTPQLLQEAINRLPADIMTPAVEVAPESRETVQAENVRVGSAFINGDGRVLVRGEDVMGERTAVPAEFRSVRAEERVKGMIRVRDALQRLRELQLSERASDAAIEEARVRLNNAYDGFVKKNGPINGQANKLLFRDDPTWPQISALEDSYDKGVSADMAKKTGEPRREPSAVKAAIFSRRTQQPHRAPDSASSAKDALVASLAERGRVDMDYMQGLYGRDADEIADELGDLLFNDPQNGWQTRDAYLSGNVKQKLAQAEAAAGADPRFARNVDALKAVQPKDIEAVDIAVKPGASWIPAEVMGQFADHLAESTGSRAFYNPLTAGWSFPRLEATTGATARYGTGRMSLGDILTAAAAQRAVQVYDTHRDGSRTLNETETQLANEKVGLVKQEWDRWIWQDDNRRTQLARLYNDQFNTDVPREFDGSHLTFPGKISDDIIRLRPHQANAVWRIVQGGSTLLDHVVGAGKTFTIVSAIMELRRMGLVRKPILAVPNHLVGQWAKDFIKLYPGANVLAATKKDFEAANRKRFFARIATGDWDVVIVAHSSFGKVAVHPETEAKFIREEIADITASIAAIEAAEGKKSRNVKQGEDRRKRMEEKLKKLLDTDSKDDSLYWDDLGIDGLLLDEAHEFKNLGYTTGMRNVAGLGNSKGSQKATDLYMKTRIVREATGGRNVVFATGTPISNTMAEMFTMQRYLDYDNLRAAGLAHFDAWARMFGEVVTDWELSPSGQYKMNSRFAKFVNMPELMQRYTSFADVINRDDINAQLAAQGKRLPVPKVKGGKPTNVVVDRSEEQARYIGEPIKDADGNPTDEYPAGSLVFRAEHLPKKAEKGKDNMLNIMSDARKAALDMRLLFPELPDNPNSKVNVAAGRIAAIYDQWEADKGTQLVFIDLSTPKASRGKEADRIRQLVEAAESDDADVASAAQEQLDRMSPDELLALESSFSVYDDLKQKLIDRGIPEKEIAFIHDANTDEQKTDLFAKVNAGTIRVLLGSTPKMGAGMNAQERLVALHHLDAPWRPSDLEQREGRIIRQGNKLYDRDPDNFEVIINRYATKQTLDSRMWQTIEAKARFIEQVRKGNTAQRQIEDIGGEAANAAEMKAASSGNPLMLEEMTLRQKVRSLENERMAHDRDQFRIRDKIREENGNIKSIQRTLTQLRADRQLEQPSKFAVTIDGQAYDKRKEAGAAVLELAREMEKSGESERENIGSYGGFRLSIDQYRLGEYALQLEGAGTYTVRFDSDKADAQGLAIRMANAVSDLGDAIGKMEKALARSQEAIPSLESQVRDWPKADELKAAEERHREVIDQLRPKKKETAAPAAEGNESQNPGDVLNSPIFNRGSAAAPGVIAKIREVLAAARAAGHAAAKATLAPVPEWLVGEARRAGLNVDGFVHVLDGSAVRHTLKNHGDAKTEGKRGQLAVTDADFERLPEVVASPDRVVFGTQNRLHKDQIGFVKRLDDGTILYLEEVRTGRKELAAVTLRKYPATMNVDAVASTLDPNARSDGGTALNIISNPAGDKTGSSLDAWRLITSARRQASPAQLAEMRRLQAQSQAMPADKFVDLVRRIEAQNRATSGNAQRVLATLQAAEKSGQYNREGLQLAQWLIRQYPRLAGNLSLETRPGRDDGIAGNYNVANRLITLFSDFETSSGERVRSTDAITATHEIMHHLERMMPRDVQEAIANEWLNALSARLNEYAANGDATSQELLTDLVAGMYGNTEALDRARDAFVNGTLPASDYQFASPSEFWAENAARMIADRKAKADRIETRNWVGKAVDTIKAIVAKIRLLLGIKPENGSPLEVALASVLAGNGEFRSDAILQRVGDDMYGLSGKPEGDYQVPAVNALRTRGKPDPTIPTQAQDDEKVRSWWEGFKDRARHAPGDKTTDAMQKGLALLPFRPLVEELGRNIPALGEYMNLKQSMDAMRSRWHARTDAVAQRWLKYRATDKATEAENVRLMDLMHESTIQQVDPSRKYNSMLTPRDHDALRTAQVGTDRGDEVLAKAAEDSRRRQEWEKLRARFNQLSPEARSIYTEVRDTYTALADAYEGVLMGNMEKAINVRIKKAEREHRRELRRIRDEGLTGQAKIDALDEANRRLKAARTKTAWNRKARITQLRQQFEMERLAGPYFPLARFGNLFVTVRDKKGKVISFSRFEKAADQREFADLMRADPQQSVQVGTLNDAASLRKAVDANFVADVEDILAELPNADKIKDEVWQRYLDTLPDFSIRKNRIHRIGRAGYTSDALRAFGNSMFHGSHQLARLAHTFDMEEALDAAREQAENTKDPVRDGMVVNEMEKRHQFIMNPTGGALANAVTQASFIYFLSASPKAAFVNMFQTAVMGVPVLAANDGKWSSMTRASRQLTRAMGDIFRGKGLTERSNRLTPEEQAALKEAYDIGLIDRTQSHDLAGIGETGVEYNPARAKVMARLAFLFHHTERINREVTFLAAYRMAKARGLSQREAIADANRMTWKIHFDYQNTSRPRIMHNDALKMLLVFRNFSINMLYRLFRDLHQSFKGDTPQVRKEARIQLAGITGMFALTAGVTGVWGFNLLMGLAGLFMSGEDDPEDELRKNMVQALGPMMAGIILDGVPGYAMRMNLTDSLGMADLWFRDPSTQLEGKEVEGYWKSQLLGAAPSIVDNWIKGYQLLQKGHEYRAVENIMPKFLKDPMKAMRFASEGVKNLRGDTVMDNLSLYELGMVAIGFTPARLAEQYDINNANFRKQDAILTQRQQLLDDYWRASEKEDDAAVSAVEDKIDAYNEKYGDDMPAVVITPKTLSRSAKTRDKNADDATGGARYSRSTREHILETQRPTIYQ